MAVNFSGAPIDLAAAMISKTVVVVVIAMAAAVIPSAWTLSRVDSRIPSLVRVKGPRLTTPSPGIEKENGRTIQINTRKILIVSSLQRNESGFSGPERQTKTNEPARPAKAPGKPVASARTNDQITSMHSLTLGSILDKKPNPMLVSPNAINSLIAFLKDQPRKGKIT
jgi:hypothetical protein